MTISEEIRVRKEPLSKLILSDMYPDSPFVDPMREHKAIIDVGWMLEYVAVGLETDNPQIVADLLVWFKTLFHGLGIEEKHADLLLASTARVLTEQFANSNLDRLLERVGTESWDSNDDLIEHNPYADHMEAYLEALMLSDRPRAKRIIDSLVADDVPIDDIYIYIFQEAMRKVGMLWHNGLIPVGREHYCTVVTQYLMSTLYPSIFAVRDRPKRLMSATVGSELHEMGIRMVSDLFELHGWDTNYLGANLPAADLVVMALEFQPQVIALSVTMPHHIGILKQTIATIRAEPKLNDVKILVGGFAFHNNARLAEAIGADGYAADARKGVEIAEQLIG